MVQQNEQGERSQLSPELLTEMIADTRVGLSVSSPSSTPSVSLRLPLARMQDAFQLAHSLKNKIKKRLRERAFSDRLSLRIKHPRAEVLGVCTNTFQCEMSSSESIPAWLL